MLAFFDTNVLVYCTASTDLTKQARARSLVAEHASAGEAVISTQVLIELFHTLTRKQKIAPALAQSLLLGFAEWPVISSDAALVRAAIDKSMQWQLSVWDAMVVEAALRSGAATLFTEDLNAGQRFGGLTVVNPFQ